MAMLPAFLDVVCFNPHKQTGVITEIEGELKYQRKPRNPHEPFCYQPAPLKEIQKRVCSYLEGEQFAQLSTKQLKLLLKNATLLNRQIAKHNCNLTKSSLWLWLLSFLGIRVGVVNAIPLAKIKAAVGEKRTYHKLIAESPFVISVRGGNRRGCYKIQKELLRVSVMRREGQLAFTYLRVGICAHRFYVNGCRPQNQANGMVTAYSRVLTARVTNFRLQGHTYRVIIDYKPNVTFDFEPNN